MIRITMMVATNFQSLFSRDYRVNDDISYDKKIINVFILRFYCLDKTKKGNLGHIK